MGAAFHAFGPIEHFIRPIGNSSWLYLGTAVQTPEIDEEDMLLPVMNDIGGRSVPVDYTQDRRKAIVTTTLNRFNYTTYNIMRGMRPPGNSGAVFYTDTVVDHGVPTIAYRYAFELLLAYTFTGTLASASDSPSGRMYYAAIPRKYRESSLNSRVAELSVLFECIGKFNPVDRSFPLYTEDPNVWGTVTPE
jgi:hypothetical protein